MTTVYVVHKSSMGYAREDPDVSSILGVWTDPEFAHKVAITQQGTVKPVELDYTPPGYARTINDIFYSLEIP